MLKKNYLIFAKLLEHGWSVTDPVLFCKNICLFPILGAMYLTKDLRFVELLIENGAIVNERTLIKASGEYSILSSQTVQNDKRKNKSKFKEKEYAYNESTLVAVTELLKISTDLEAAIHLNQFDLLLILSKYRDLAQHARAVSILGVNSNIFRQIFLPNSLSKGVMITLNEQEFQSYLKGLPKLPQKVEFASFLLVMIYKNNNFSQYIKTFEMFLKEFNNRCQIQNKKIREIIDKCLNALKNPVTSLEPNALLEAKFICFTAIILFPQQGLLTKDATKELAWCLSKFGGQVPELKNEFYKIADFLVKTSPFYEALKDSPIVQFLEKNVIVEQKPVIPMSNFNSNFTPLHNNTQNRKTTATNTTKSTINAVKYN